jgi:hypothetical protein
MSNESAGLLAAAFIGIAPGASLHQLQGLADDIRLHFSIRRWFL